MKISSGSNHEHPEYLLEQLFPRDFLPQTGRDIQSLYRVLSPDKPNVDLNGIGRALPNVIAWIARERTTDKVVAMATLIICPPSLRQNRIGTIEDVVTLKEHREHGIMRSLLENIIRRARSESLLFLQLTSRPDPDRDAARKLYESLGFICIAEAVPGVKGQTNVYQLSFR
ncbi:MAG: GNAT family N-acetyltransferase [Candidatus Moraniibacteriota bacterium]